MPQAYSSAQIRHSQQQVYYVSSEFDDPDPLTLVPLLYGRWIK